MELTSKRIIGLAEKISLKGKDHQKKVVARIDTGAVMSSIDTALAAELGLGPIIKTKRVKNANGVTRRPVVNCEIEMKGKKVKAQVTLADRKLLTYRVLIGQNFLKKTNFYINPRKKIKQ